MLKCSTIDGQVDHARMSQYVRLMLEHVAQLLQGFRQARNHQALSMTMLWACGCKPRKADPVLDKPSTINQLVTIVVLIAGQSTM
jgi:hypothetical protein